MALPCYDTSMKIYLILFLFLSVPLFASLEPKPIPRTPIKHFQNEGIFEGGSKLPANVEGIRFSSHKKEGYERWVLDFSDEATRSLGKVAPQFQLRYQKATKVEVPGGTDISLTPPKFIFALQGVKQNYLKKETLQRIAHKSRFVKEIILFPAIENGDVAIEFVLKDNVLFEPHQPREKEGRLVLDLKNAPLGQ